MRSVEAWAGERGAEVVQVRTPGSERTVAPTAAAEDCDAASRARWRRHHARRPAAAAPAGRPVLGVACGSLGALTAVTAADLRGALDAVAAGRWELRRLPARRSRGRRRAASGRGQRPRARAPRRGPGHRHGARGRRALRPRRGRRAGRRDAAGLQRVHARRRRPRARSWSARHGGDPARAPWRLLAAAGHGPGGDARDRARARLRRGAAGGRRADRARARAAAHAAVHGVAARRPRPARRPRRPGADARRAAPPARDHRQPAPAGARRPCAARPYD